MFTLRSLYIVLLVTLTLNGFTYSKKISVITTTEDLASITRSIGGEKIQVDSIARGYQNPHFVDAKPSYMLKLSKADAFVKIGLDLETWGPLLIDGSRNKKIFINAIGHIDASKGIPLLEKPIGQVDRSGGDIHVYGNPHYWLDPLNGIVIAENITIGLKRVDPTNTDYYDNNLEKLKNQIYVALFGQALVDEVGGDKLSKISLSDKLGGFLQQSKLSNKLGGWLKKMEPFKGTKIITYHKSWPYFTERFGLDTRGEIEPKPGIPPTPNHIVDVINLVKRDNIKIIIMEPYFSEKVPNLIASKTEVKVVKLPPSVGGDKSVTDYISLFEYNLNTIIDALK